MRLILLLSFCNFLTIFGTKNSTDYFEKLISTLLVKTEPIGMEEEEKKPIRTINDEKVPIKCIKMEIGAVKMENGEEMDKKAFVDDQKREKKCELIAPKAIADQKMEEEEEKMDNDQSGEKSAKIRETIEKFDKIKKAIKAKSGRRNISAEQIETKIALRIGSSRLEINKWKKELGLKMRINKLNDSEQLKIVEQFERIKMEFMAKFNEFPDKKIEAKIAKKLGFSALTIKRWKSKFGMTQSKRFDDAQKRKIVRAYEAMKKRHPRMRTVDIARKLGIGDRTLCYWRKIFGTEKC